MRKNVVFLLFAVGILFSVVSCQTGPVYEKLSSTDCLVLIPTVVVKDANTEILRYFKFHLSDGTTRRVWNKPNDVIQVYMTEPGLRLTGISSHVDTNALGNHHESELDLELPYKPGKVIVSDYTFMQRQEKINDGRYQSSIGFIETTPEQRQKSMDMFRKMSHSASWLK